MTDLTSSQPAKGSSSSELMGESLACEPILRLGRQLVTELELEGSVDTLGRWMAHHIAELIEKASAATDDEKPAKMRECREAISQLWRHRVHYRRESPIFEKEEQVARVVASLDPENEAFRYASTWMSDALESGINEGAGLWLKFVLKVDEVACLLIRFALAEAASPLSEESKQLADLAEAAGMNEDAEMTLVKFLESQQGLFSETESSDEKRDDVRRSQFKLLTDFVEMATIVKARYEAGET